MVRVARGRLDQQRHHDAGEDAAQHQVVDGVGQRVGVVVVVGQRPGAERGDEDEGAQEPGDARGERAYRHAGAGPDQAGPLPGGRRRRPWRSRRTGRGVSGARVRGGLGFLGRGLAGWRVVGGPGHPAPAGGRPWREGRSRCTGRGRARSPGRPGRRGGPAERQRQRGLGRSRAAAQHRALDRRQRVRGGVAAPARTAGFFGIITSRHGSSGHTSSRPGGPPGCSREGWPRPGWPRPGGPRRGSGVVDPASCIGQVIRCLRRV